ncbi:MAG: SUMF1/EgtB/PvdO family nonheme iron enzyme [Deltaproteobacteria bacterium]|nr:SUMF1/EgtB/PvdO family nonheme iron enzyme [Deltaproteobacteria bacterium]
MASTIVSVDDFTMDETEVTTAQYATCVRAGRCTPSDITDPRCNMGLPDTGRHPVNCVSLPQAREYCQWAGRRLCTKLEFHRAGGWPEGNEFPWGNGFGQLQPCDYANLGSWPRCGSDDSGCGHGTTEPVGSRPLGANQFGVMDLVGNVAEWVDDWMYPVIDGRQTPRRAVFGGGFAWCPEFSYSNCFQVVEGEDAGDYRISVGIRCCGHRGRD